MHRPTLDGFFAAVLYGIAILARGYTKNVLEPAGQMTLVGKPGRIGYFGNGVTLGKETPRMSDADLVQVGMRGQAGGLLENSD